MRVKFTLLVLLAGALALGADDPSLAPLLQSHRWFELRAATRSGSAPAFYRGMVAAAFNDTVRAEKELRAAIQSGASGPEQFALHEALFSLYLRNGAYRKAALEARQKWAVKPESASSTEKTLVPVFERLPELTVVSRKSASVTYKNADSGQIVAPVAINGHAANFLLDTGMNMSVISAALAKHLGMRSVAEEIPFSGVTGETAPGAQMAIADHLTFGQTVFRNVTFLVLSDQQQPFVDWPLEERGVLGLPVLLGVQGFGWTREHRLDIGLPPSRPASGSSNLCFEGTDPLAEVEVAGRRVTFAIDTGGHDSEAWPNFGKQFPELLEVATKGTRELRGITGEAKLDAAVLPELRLKLGGLPLIFRQAPVLLSTTVASSDWHYGRISMDLLNQAREVSFDFKNMGISLR